MRKSERISGALGIFFFSERRKIISRVPSVVFFPEIERISRNLGVLFLEEIDRISVLPDVVFLEKVEIIWRLLVFYF